MKTRLVYKRTLAMALRQSNYAVDVAGDGEEGLWLARVEALCRRAYGAKQPSLCIADLEIVPAMAQQMERIVTHILALARGEQGQLAVKLDPLSSHPCSRWFGKIAPPAPPSANWMFRVCSVAFAATADRGLAAAILNSLLENVVDYAPPGGRIAITIDARDTNIAVVIANPASDSAPEDVPILFDRFWRKEAVRSDGAHLGLGLSLVRAFAVTMGWKLTAVLAPRNEIGLTLLGPAAAVGTAALEEKHATTS